MSVSPLSSCSFELSLTPSSSYDGKSSESSDLDSTEFGSVSPIFGTLSSDSSGSQSFVSETDSFAKSYFEKYHQSSSSPSPSKNKSSTSKQNFNQDIAALNFSTPRELPSHASIPSHNLHCSEQNPQGLRRNNAGLNLRQLDEEMSKTPPSPENRSTGIWTGLYAKPVGRLQSVSAD